MPTDPHATLHTRPSGYRFAPMVRQFVLAGPGSRFECTKGVCQLGVHASNDLVLDNEKASRFHCEVRLEGQRATVLDLGSTNGTYVDGVPVGVPQARQHADGGHHAARLVSLEEQVRALPMSESSRFGSLVALGGDAPGFFGAEKAARTDATVLLEGETGTGKSRAALALHQAGGRAERPFLVVDCGALPPRAARGRAVRTRERRLHRRREPPRGRFEEASGGTVLLDEIGEVPLEPEPRACCACSRTSRFAGWGRPVDAGRDVRLVAATRRDLRAPK